MLLMQIQSLASRIAKVVVADVPADAKKDGVEPSPPPSDDPPPVDVAQLSPRTPVLESLAQWAPIHDSYSNVQTLDTLRMVSIF